uniref:Uncharacterized protein n=1 Tax=Acrobeloides nanus TaxID=290746 RepID=A0A914BWN6_9BILA
MFDPFYFSSAKWSEISEQLIGFAYDMSESSELPLEESEFEESCEANMSDELARGLLIEEGSIRNDTYFDQQVPNVETDINFNDIWSLMPQSFSTYATSSQNLKK